MGSQTPPWNAQVRCPFAGDPPELSQSQLWSFQARPGTALRAREPPKDLSNSQGRPSKNVMNMCICTSRNTKNVFFIIFGPLIRLLGRTLACAFAIQTLPMVLQSIPEPSQGPPRTTIKHPYEFHVGSCSIRNRRLPHFTQILVHFHQFSNTIRDLQIGP